MFSLYFVNKEMWQKRHPTIGMKGEFAKVARRLMRETPEYDQARREGRARDWLEQESASFAESAYELLLTRLQDLDP